MKMNNLQERFAEAREQTGLTQAELAERVGVSQTAVLNIENGKTKKSGYLADLARELGVTYDWLAEGIGPRRLVDAPGSGDANLPFFHQRQINANSSVVEINDDGPWQRIQQTTLASAQVDVGNAACVEVRGTAMHPVLPDGTITAVDRGNTAIADGDLYAIDWHGELYVRVLIRRPGGGLRIRSYNSNEYPDENLPREEAEQITVLGRVFWYSVLR